MAYLITHFFEGGTEQQYRTTVAAVHPDKGLPDGQSFHAAGPTDGGWLVVALWDSKADCDTFIGETLVPALQKLDGAFSAPPQERASEVVNVEYA